VAERVAVLGASGLVGRALLAALEASAPAEGLDLLGTALTDAHALPGGRPARRLDVHDPVQLANLLHDFRPTTVVAATRYPREGGDYTTEQRDREVKLARRLASWLEKTGGRLVLLSTASVFSGRTGAYREDDAPDPVTRYGEARAEMERQIAALGCVHLVARLGRTDGFRPGAPTRFAALCRALRAGETVERSGDARLNPVSAAATAAALARLMGARAEGTWHLAGAEALSEAEHARRTAAALGVDAALVREARGEGEPVTLTLDPSRAHERLRALSLKYPPPFDEDLRALAAAAPRV
jgi:dTDP-4-dehydrorhamnose reductase